MKRTFIFDIENENWIEETEILLFHDILAIFDENSHSIYLWKGPEVKETKIEQGKIRLKELISSTSDFKWKINEKNESFPSEIQEILNSMLEPTRERRKEDALKFSRILTIRICFLLLIGITIFNTLSLVSILIPLFFPTSGTSYLISASFYTIWLTLYQAFAVVTIILCIINIIVSLYERDEGVFIISLMGAITNIGIVLYLQKGIFLFLHQPGSTSSLYLILVLDMIIFFLLNLMALLIAFLPNLYKLISFTKVYWKFIYISSKTGIESESESR